VTYILLRKRRACRAHGDRQHLADGDAPLILIRHACKIKARQALAISASAVVSPQSGDKLALGLGNALVVATWTISNRGQEGSPASMAHGFYLPRAKMGCDH